MAPKTNTPDITVRGGLINVPSSAIPQPPPRHQPDTPTNKKSAPIKPDHLPAPTKTPAAIPPATPEPEGDPDNVPTEASQSD